jgi:endonuclease YncB( thermonuclease family)
MPTRELTVPVYKKLVTEIACLYEGARKALVEAYWTIGKRIVEVEQQGTIKAAYGTGLLIKLSEDLTRDLGQGFSKRNLERMRAFYLAYPKTTTSSQLAWSHFVELLSVRDRKERIRIEKQAIEEELTAHDVRRLVRQETVREQVALNLVRSEDEVPYGSPNRQLLEPVRGTLYAYRIFQPTSLDKSSKTRQVVVGAKATTKLVGETDSELLIDLGFSSYKDLDSVTSRGLKLGDIVISEKAQSGFTLRVARCPAPINKLTVSRTILTSSKISNESQGCALSDLYTYKASVEKVVDGDTLRVVVDLGFGFKTRQYLRLRGLDCPEMDTPEGKKASDFVKARIRTADQITLTSSRSDKYDRYLADVYYTDDQGKEQFLNNLLLEQGLAVRMKE